MNSINTIPNPSQSTSIADAHVPPPGPFATLRRLAALCACLLLAASAWGLTPAQLIGVSGTPTAPGKISIAIGTDVIEVQLTAGMNCEQICDAIKTAAAASGSTAWMQLEIECINDGGCYIRLRRKDGGHVAQPKVTEELDDISFDHPILKDSCLKISGITAPPPIIEGKVLLWTNCITISVNGRVPPRSYCVVVDNDPATGPGSQPAKYPTTPQEIADELRKKIAEDPDLAANTNNDAQVFVFIEGRVTVLDLGPQSPTNFPYAGESQPYRHALTVAVRPSSGPQTGEYIVQVHGSGLGPGAEILFGDQPAKVLRYDPAQDVYTVIVPPSPMVGPVDVVAIPNRASQDEFNTLPAGFAYLPDCRLSTLSIVQQPMDAVVFVGHTVTFTVGAEGTPPPTVYQWQWWGPGSEPFTNLPPAIGPSLTLRVNPMDNGAQVRCLVGNGCETVVSAVATLTVPFTLPNQSPVLAPIPNQAVHAGTLIKFTVPANDPDGLAQTLTYTLEGGPDGASIDPVTGEFRWSPTAAHIGLPNHVVVRVTDSGQPALSDVRDFFINVAPLPVIVGRLLTGDSLELTWTSVPGNTYRIETTEDLASHLWTELVGNLSAQDTLASWSLSGLDAPGYRFIRIGVVAAVNGPVGVAADAVTNHPAWTCCERNIQFPKTVKIDTGATTALTNNNTRRFVTVDVKLPLDYRCADVDNQKCIADLLVKVVFRPRQADAVGEYTGDLEEEIIETIQKPSPPDCDDKEHSTEIIIRWRGTYKARRDIKGTLNLELSVPGAKGTINHSLSVDVASASSPKAEKPVLKRLE